MKPVVEAAMVDGEDRVMFNNCAPPSPSGIQIVPVARHKEISVPPPMLHEPRALASLTTTTCPADVAGGRVATVYEAMTGAARVLPVSVWVSVVPTIAPEGSVFPPSASCLPLPPLKIATLPLVEETAPETSPAPDRLQVQVPTAELMYSPATKVTLKNNG